ncbi:MAG: site-specific DNA-methyltransferase [Bacilli bacterium]
MNKKCYFEDNNFSLILGNTFSVLKSIEPKSIDMIFADPPYFISGGGVTCNSGHQVSVNKADWDTKISIKEKLAFNKKRLRLCASLLKDDGTIWISGTFHNIYSIGVALEEEGFSIINNITWQKRNPPPNLACRCFTNSTETIIWARKQLTPNKKGNHLFNYQLMKTLNNDKQMKDVRDILPPNKKEKEFGKHPTQKPLELLKRIILASTNENDIVLDPFTGSSTTGIACCLLNRRFIGIDNYKDYLDLSIKRYKALKEELNDE